MTYTITSTKTPEQVVADLQRAAADHQFGVLNIHNLQETLHKKGFDLAQSCYVLDVCNPKQASKVLGADMSMSVALPCRISVYSGDGHTFLSTIAPTAVLGMLSTSPALAEVAREVEDTMKKIMDQAAQA